MGYQQTRDGIQILEGRKSVEVRLPSQPDRETTGEEK